MTTENTRRDFLAGRALLRLADRSEPVEERTAPSGGPTVRLETRAMACPWSVVMNPGPPQWVMAAGDALDLAHEIEAQLSIFRDETPIARIRTLQPGESLELPAEVFELLQQCRSYAEATRGAFDPTSGPLNRIWRDCRQVGRIPEPGEIEAVLERTGISRVLELAPSSHSVRVSCAGVEVDLGAIGKGYAIDRIVEQLASPHPQPLSRGERGESNSPETTCLPDFLVHGGYSSLRAVGTHNGHSGWPVGLRNPLFPDRNYATLLLRDRAMATSGSNVQFFRHQGKRYGHILDPRTGWPVEGMLSVTVVAPTAAAADALSTAFYVMGLDAAAEYCRAHTEIGAILVPPLTEGRTLTPLILNIAEDDLFFGDGVVVES
jgi:thiamine biosynthesis lipoprotein